MSEDSLFDLRVNPSPPINSSPNQSTLLQNLDYLSRMGLSVTPPLSLSTLGATLVRSTPIATPMHQSHSTHSSGSSRTRGTNWSDEEEDLFLTFSLEAQRECEGRGVPFQLQSKAHLVRAAIFLDQHGFARTSEQCSNKIREWRSRMRQMTIGGPGLFCGFPSFLLSPSPTCLFFFNYQILILIHAFFTLINMSSYLDKNDVALNQIFTICLVKKWIDKI